MNFSIRQLSRADESTLWTMLMHAAHESSLSVVMSNPDLVRYVESWGRTGDLGVVAEQEDIAVGAAWVRLWSAGDLGYGYVAEGIPELAIAVVPEARGKGIGTALLSALLSLAKTEFPAVSLSIRADNAALRLYERMGFTRVVGSEVTNRAGGVSFSMVYRFDTDL